LGPGYSALTAVMVVAGLGVKVVVIGMLTAAAYAVTGLVTLALHYMLNQAVDELEADGFECGYQHNEKFVSKPQSLSLMLDATIVLLKADVDESAFSVETRSMNVISGGTSGYEKMHHSSDGKVEDTQITRVTVDTEGSDAGVSMQCKSGAASDIDDMPMAVGDYSRDYALIEGACSTSLFVVVEDGFQVGLCNDNGSGQTSCSGWTSTSLEVDESIDFDTIRITASCIAAKTVIDQRIKKEEMVVSPNGMWGLRMDESGELVLLRLENDHTFATDVNGEYDIVWRSGVKGADYAEMLPSGNFAMFRINNQGVLSTDTELWSTGTGNPTTQEFATLSNIGRFEIYKVGDQNEFDCQDEDLLFSSDSHPLFKDCTGSCGTCPQCSSDSECLSGHCIFIGAGQGSVCGNKEGKISGGGCCNAESDCQSGDCVGASGSRTCKMIPNCQSTCDVCPACATGTDCLSGQCLYLENGNVCANFLGNIDDGGCCHNGSDCESGDCGGGSANQERTCRAV